MDPDANPFEIGQKAPTKKTKAKPEPKTEPVEATEEEQPEEVEETEEQPVEEAPKAAKAPAKKAPVKKAKAPQGFHIEGELPQTQASEHFYVSAEKMNGLEVVSISQRGWVGPPQITFLASWVDELTGLFEAFSKK